MLDLVVIVAIGISILVGMRLGFIRTVYQLVSSLVAFVGAMVVYPAVSAVIKLTPVYSFIQEAVANFMPAIDEKIGLQSQGDAIYEATEWLPSFITEGIVANNNPEVYEMLGVTKFVDYISVSITNICITVLAIVVAWVCIKIVLSIGVSILDLVAKLPLLRTANKVAGGLVGAVRGMLGVWLVCIILPFLTLIPSLAFINEQLQTSVLTKFLYENNKLLQIGMDFFVK